MTRGVEDLSKKVQRAWNEFDPIGVVEDVESDDEYSSYVGHTVQLILQRADTYKLRTYATGVVTQNIGLSVKAADLDAFVGKLLGLQES